MAMGQNPKGAWAAAFLLAHAIHPDKEGVNVLKNWPVNVPSGAYWLPFEASSSPRPDSDIVTEPPSPVPAKPTVPFGVRIWGSPMPTLPSYQRLIRQLKDLGVNTILVQSGGWVDLPHAERIFSQALDIAWQEGIYTVFYVGNEERPHYPAPFSSNHRKVVMVTKDHPGLMGYHIYNQLTSPDNMSGDEYEILKEQIQWIKSKTDKPLGIEIVWGHNITQIPEPKKQLMKDVKQWGVDVIATDYAPIGGWSKEPDLQKWELKILELLEIEDSPEAVLQAHVPFLGATVPSAAQVRNQYWWSLAGGAKAFYYEAAYNFTHFSMRGLLTWDLKPQPDGRYDTIRHLSEINHKLSHLITNSEITHENPFRSMGLSLSGQESQNASLRLRKIKDNDWYLIIINEVLTSESSVQLNLAKSENLEFLVKDELTQSIRGMLLPGGHISLQISAGGGIALKLITQ